MYAGNVSLAQRYLEGKVSTGVVSNYSLCLMAYALALANSPVAGTALAELSRRADFRGKLVKLFCCLMFRNVAYHQRSRQLLELVWLRSV